MPQGGTWHWVVPIAATARQPQGRLQLPTGCQRVEATPMAPEPIKWVIDMSWVNSLDICASFHFKHFSVEYFFPYPVPVWHTVGDQKNIYWKKMNEEMIHIQSQQPSYINGIDKKIVKSQVRVKGNNFEEWEDISPEDSTTLGLGAWVLSKKEKKREELTSVKHLCMMCYAHSKWDFIFSNNLM